MQTCAQHALTDATTAALLAQLLSMNNIDDGRKTHDVATEAGVRLRLL